jgi:hypothetical protein
MNNSSQLAKRSAVLATAGVAALFCFTSALAQDLEPSKIDVSVLGPQVGDVIPEFSLPDQTGKVWTNESIIGENGAMLVFIRSADW